MAPSIWRFAVTLLLATSPILEVLAGSCNQCNIPLVNGGCKCDNNCNCLPGLGGSPCDKCNIAVSSGGCKCDSNCNCITSTGSSNDPCAKCNLPASSGGCKCDNNCNCLAPSGGGSTGSASVLYSGTNVGGTYYYDLRTSCNGEQYAENNGYPRCTSNDPSKYQTLAQLGTNNVVAIDNNVLGANLAGLCGKKVLVYRADGSQVAAPDGGDFFVWDGCQACIGGGRLDFSVSGLTNVNPSACNLGVVPGVSFKVVDQVVKQYVP